MASAAAASAEPVFKLANGAVVYDRNRFEFYNHMESFPIRLYPTGMEKLMKELKVLKVMAAQKQELLDAKKEKHLATGGLPENFPLVPNEEIMRVDICSVGRNETKLIYNVFNNKPYIWLKQMYHPKDNPTDLKFGLGGVLFEPDDSYEELAEFVSTFTKKKKSNFPFVKRFNF